MKRIESEVRLELKRFGPAAGMVDLVRLWPEAVGEAIAANAWPARLARDGSLYVSASSSAWAFELTQLESDIRGRLAAALGDAAPSRLRFAAGPLPEVAAKAGARAQREPVRATAEERVEAAKVAAVIADEELRDLVARAAAASLARAGSDRRFW